MNINNLSKQDTIWLALFVSFVTAIVTGIVVVFLYPESRPALVPLPPAASSQPAEQTTSSTSILPDEQTVTSSNQASTTSSEESQSMQDQPAEGTDLTRQEVFEMVTNAVTRITVNGQFVGAGILVNSENSAPFSPAIISSTDDVFSGENISVLFENGDEFAVNREASSYGSVFSLVNENQPTQATPLPIESITEGEAVFVLLAADQPQFIETVVTNIEQTYEGGRQITLRDYAAEELPPGSVVFSDQGEVLGMVISTDTGPIIATLGVFFYG